MIRNEVKEVLRNGLTHLFTDAGETEFQPVDADRLVQYLEENGFVLVPKTIVGISGWTPSEEEAYRMGIMYARYHKESDENLYVE